ncbi:MAG: caspase family protein [Solidesulfovibrio sp.]|uniref:caspase family protein n=1 Tax=Solidesulfovibrio sp. TaxID=2910990 RepID=UPI003158B4F9
MNIAILIGISEYSHADQLPACANDVESIHQVISLSKKFKNILCLSGKVNSTGEKSSLIDFIKEHQKSKIDELFFYFSGHGIFNSNEFYYVLSDYDSTKVAQSSLNNSELDQLIKSLDPKITIKIVDACQSGISYVKDPESFKAYLTEKKNNFAKCYFMFSSNIDQPSYASRTSSNFTSSLLASIKNINKNSIRYKDVIDYISDDFMQDEKQTPFFVIQADYTEEFLENADLIREHLDSTSHTIPALQEIQLQPHSLEDTIKEYSKQYASKDEVLSLFKTIQNELPKIALDAQIKKIFTLQHVFLDHARDIPKQDVIGRWIAEQSKKENIFARIKTKNESYETETVDRNILSVYYGTPRTVTRYRDVTSGFESTAATPYVGVQIIAKSSYVNLPWYVCIILFLLSKKRIFMFNFNSFYSEDNWDTRNIDTDFKWKYAEEKTIYPQKIIDQCTSIVKNFSDYILNDIKARIEKDRKDSATE